MTSPFLWFVQYAMSFQNLYLKDFCASITVYMEIIYSSINLLVLVLIFHVLQVACADNQFQS